MGSKKVPLIIVPKFIRKVKDFLENHEILSQNRGFCRIMLDIYTYIVYNENSTNYKNNTEEVMPMKRIMTAALCLMLALLTGTSCTGNKNQEPVNMDELMTISTWLLDDELEGTGRWGYIASSERTFPYTADGDGYWIPDDGVTEVANEDVFEYDTLQLGVPRTMAPMTMHMARNKGDGINYSNLNLFIEFDGIVKVKKLEPNDSSIRLRYSLNGPPIGAEEISLTAPCGINICPVGKVLVTEGVGDSLVSSDTLTGKEYTIQIQGCSMGGEPIVTAVVKLTAIEDPEYPWQTIHSTHYGEHHRANEERTRFCSVELISYTYSEMYILGGAAGELGS